jgi:hypothetical protein
MIRAFDHRRGAPRRAGAALLSLFFAVSLVAAPLLHQRTCTGACAAGASFARAAAGRDAAPPCHAAGAAHGKRGGCQCTDDCCSLLAQFVAPPDVADDGPTVLLPAGILPATPDASRRAPAARLLPYPNGPPPSC